MKADVKYPFIILLIIAYCCQVSATVIEIGCSLPWESYKDKCFYSVNPQSVYGETWRDARIYCQKQGGDLITINSPDANQYMKDTYNKTKTNHRVWIGLKYDRKERKYHWINGDLLDNSQTKWADSQPNKDKDYDCIEAKWNSQWASNKCDAKQGFICEKSSDSECNPGWIPWRKSCYFVDYDTSRRYKEASQHCKSLYGHLVRIESPQEQKFLQYLLGNKNQEYWIGLARNSDYEMVWENGIALDPHITSWAFGQPSTYRGDNCVVMDGYVEPGKWTASDCSAYQYYICEKVRGQKDPEEEKKTMSPGLVVGIVFIILMIVTALALVIYYMIRKRNPGFKFLGGSSRMNIALTEDDEMS